MRYLYLAIGSLALLLGCLGIFLPILPTVPFVLLAAFCFAQSSPRLHDWLLGHKTFGPMIIDWRDRGAISRRAKLLATLSIGAAFLVPFLIGMPAWVIGVEAVILSLVLIFIWSRPD